MSLGNTLRAAREACGITTSELAARTHMLVQIVEGLENEDFRRIPAPIYGRGFIKLYCEAVNIDPKPLQAEFMELFNRPKNAAANADPPRRPAPPPMPAPEPSLTDAEPPPAPAAEPPQTDAEPPRSSIAEFGELFAQPPKLAPVQRPAGQPLPTPTQASPQPKRSYGDIFGQAYETGEEMPKQSAAEKFRNTMSNVSSGVFSNVQKLPTNIGRIAAVSLCAAFAVAIIAWGVFALYKATSPAEEAPVKNSETAAKEAAGPKSAEGNTGKKAGENTAGKGVIETVKTGTAYPSSRAVRPGDLKSSGIEIPALYID